MHQFAWILKRQGDLFNLLQKGGWGGGGGVGIEMWRGGFPQRKGVSNPGRKLCILCFYD